jgi:hypothetical protein
MAIFIFNSVYKTANSLAVRPAITILARRRCRVIRHLNFQGNFVSSFRKVVCHLNFQGNFVRSFRDVIVYKGIVWA